MVKKMAGPQVGLDREGAFQEGGGCGKEGGDPKSKGQREPAEYKRSRYPRDHTASEIRDELVHATQKQVKVEKRELQRTKAAAVREIREGAKKRTRRGRPR